MDYSKAKEKITLTIDAMTAITLHGNISLGLRHPKNRGPSAASAREMLETLEQELLKIGFFDNRDIEIIHRDQSGDLSDEEYHRFAEEDFRQASQIVAKTLLLPMFKVGR